LSTSRKSDIATLRVREHRDATRLARAQQYELTALCFLKQATASCFVVLLLTAACRIAEHHVASPNFSVRTQSLHCCKLIRISSKYACRLYTPPTPANDPDTWSGRARLGAAPYPVATGKILTRVRTAALFPVQGCGYRGGARRSRACGGAGGKEGASF
jgi:hypothetical protein